MRLNVEHVTRYTYDQPVRGVVQSHRLTPTQYEGQAIIDWQISVTDAQMGGGFRDGAGTWVQGWSVRGPISVIEVTVRGAVETTDLSGVLRGLRESIPPTAWLGDTPATEPSAALHELAASAPDDGLALAHALSEAVSEAITYRPGVTDARTTAAQSLALGEGVCQDHAHALIACAHLRDLPARYVSGYLFATLDSSDHEAAHAWAEIWIAGLGWVGFDASNRCCPDDRYVRLGCGADAADAAPIRGIARSLASETMEIAVAVSSAQQ